MSSIVVRVVTLPALLLWCRYTVRDVGFAVLEPAPFTLELRAPRGADDAQWTDVRARVARSAVLDVEMLEPGEIGEGVWLRDREGRRKSVGATAAPAALETLLESPLRTELARECVERLAVVLLLECGDAEADASAVETCERAVAQVERRMPAMAKFVGSSPLVRRLDSDEQRTESWFLFSLGVEETPVSAPTVALVYGRGRRTGPLWVGDALREPALTDGLGLLGMDCECGLDRAILRGRASLLSWNEETAARAARVLDFDPADPLVRAEMHSILGAGGRGRNSAGDLGLGGDDLLAGYVETSVDALVGNREPALGTSDESSAESVAREREADRVVEDQAPHPTKPDPAAPSRDPSVPRLGWVLGGIALVGISGAAILLFGRRER